MVRTDGASRVVSVKGVSGLIKRPRTLDSRISRKWESLGGFVFCPFFPDDLWRIAVDIGGFDGSDGCDKLLDRFGPFVDFGLDGLHDRPRQFRIDIRHHIDQILWFSGIVLKRCATGNDLALPRMLEAAQAVERHSERKNIDTFIGRPASNDFGRHVQRRPGSIARSHERRRRGYGQPEVNQFRPFDIRQADEIPRADVAVDEFL